MQVMGRREGRAEWGEGRGDLGNMRGGVRWHPREGCLRTIGGDWDPISVSDPIGTGSKFMGIHENP